MDVRSCETTVRTNERTKTIRTNKICSWFDCANERTCLCSLTPLGVNNCETRKYSNYYWIVIYWDFSFFRLLKFPSISSQYETSTEFLKYIYVYFLRIDPICESQNLSFNELFQNCALNKNLNVAKQLRTYLSRELISTSNNFGVVRLK